MRHEQITVFDDLDGTEGAETVRFGLGGENFEIDLSEANHAKLAEIAGFYIGHGRKAAREFRPGRPASVYAHFGSSGRSGGPRAKRGKEHA